MSYDEKVKKSKLDEMDPNYQPLFPKAGWRRELRDKEKAMKRSNWYKGKESKDESWTGLPKSRPGGRISKLSQPRRRKRFLKAGKETKRLVAATVIFVPSTKGSIPGGWWSHLGKLLQQGSW